MKKALTLATLLSVLLAALSLAAGCRPPQQVNLRADDNGRQVELKRGQTLVATLEGNPTTGYTWEVGEGLDEGVLSCLSDRTGDKWEKRSSNRSPIWSARRACSSSASRP